METHLSQQQAQHLAQQIGWHQPVVVTQVHEYNHVYRIVSGANAGYLKTYTKDWYGDDVAATAGCVEHEVAAWHLLSVHGLAAPEVLLAERSCENPLSRPFVLSSALPGVALTDALADEWRDQALRAVGDYLRRMHTIAFTSPGYIMAAGPVAGPEDSWQHPIWRFEVWQRNALGGLERGAGQLPEALYQQLRAEFAGAARVLRPAYAPPRFTHGDCWARQFFVDQSGGQHVTGVVDMEVASAGDAESDFVHLLIELAALLPHTARWWEQVFEGYGRAPDLAAFRLRLLATSKPEFAAMGWPGSHAERLARLIVAGTWNELLSI